MVDRVAAGDRVRVRLRDRAGWARGAAAALDGKAGTVEEVQTEHNAGTVTRPVDPPRVLVRFDEPARPWHSYQAPVSAFWFDLREVERTGEEARRG